MADFREKNYGILKEKHPRVWSFLTGSEPQSYDVFENDTGDRVPAVVRDGKKIFLHSKFNPYKEAERMISEIRASDFDLIVVFGFGFAYHLEVLLGKMMSGAMLLVIEKDPSIIQSALTNRNLVNLLSDDRVIILVNPGEDDIADMLKGKSSRKTGFVTHRGSYQLDPRYYTSLAGLARSYLSTKEVNIATLAKFEKIWASNMARNIKRFITLPDIASFYNQFSNMPALVVAAGPSLSQSLDFVRDCADRAVIIAVDTAYRILLDHDIEPHFCIAVDPQIINARYFEGIRESRTVLIVDPTVHPSVCRLFKGRAATTGVAFDIMKWIEKISGAKGEISHGGSVSTNAYDFAVRLGARPVVLVGQDLAFTGGYAHVKGSYLDELVHFSSNRISTPEMFNRRQLTALPKILMKGIRSREVHTNQKMSIFLSWFEKRNDHDLINASADGAYMPGVRHVDAGELSFSRIGEDLFLRIDDIYHADRRDNNDDVAKALLRKIVVMDGEAESILPILEKAVRFSENLIEVMKAEHRDQGKVDYILKKLGETDKALETKKEIKDIISISIQRVIHTVTEGYDIDENDQSLQETELIAKRSLYLYKGILEGAHFNRKIFKTMIHLLHG